MKNILRARFYAETDIHLEPDSNNWKLYANWLETFSVEKLNIEIIDENKKLREKLNSASDILNEF